LSIETWIYRFWRWLGCVRSWGLGLWLYGWLGLAWIATKIFL